MKLIHIDPTHLAPSELNERKQTFGTNELEEHLNAVGIRHPVIVTEAPDRETGYEVLIGKRRTHAAHAAGLEEIPALVVDWDDEEAIASSISENVWRTDVHPDDRAKALERLWEEMGGDGFPSAQALSERLGAKRQTVQEWLEPLRPEWKEVSEEEDDGDRQVSQVDNNSKRALRQAATDDETKKADTEDLATATETVVEEGLTQDDVREAKKVAEETGSTATEAVEQVAQDEGDDDGTDHGTFTVSIEYEAPEDDEVASALERYSKDEGYSYETIAERAFKALLEQEGYL